MKYKHETGPRTLGRYESESVWKGTGIRQSLFIYTPFCFKKWQRKIIKGFTKKMLELWLEKKCQKKKEKKEDRDQEGKWRNTTEPGRPLKPSAGVKPCDAHSPTVKATPGVFPFVPAHACRDRELTAVWR